MVGILFRFLLGQTAYFQVRTGRFVSGSGLLLVSLEPPCCWLFRCNLHGLFDPNIFIIFFQSSVGVPHRKLFTAGSREDHLFAKGKIFEAHLHLHLARLTWNLRIHPWKRRNIFQTIIFRFHVNLGGCIQSSVPAVHFFSFFFFSPCESFSEVHCLRHQLLGRWHFFLGPAQKESGNLAANPKPSWRVSSLEEKVLFEINHRCGKNSMELCWNRWFLAFYLNGLCFTHLLEYPYVYDIRR